MGEQMTRYYKVLHKYQITLTKGFCDELGLEVGDEVVFIPVGNDNLYRFKKRDPKESSVVFYKSKVTTQYQITIPASVRRDNYIEKNDDVAFTFSEDQVFFSKKEKITTLSSNGLIDLLDNSINLYKDLIANGGTLESQAFWFGQVTAYANALKLEEYHEKSTTKSEYISNLKKGINRMRSN